MAYCATLPKPCTLALVRDISPRALGASGARISIPTVASVARAICPYHRFAGDKAGNHCGWSRIHRASTACAASWSSRPGWNILKWTHSWRSADPSPQIVLLASTQMMRITQPRPPHECPLRAYIIPSTGPHRIDRLKGMEADTALRRTARVVVLNLKPWYLHRTSSTNGDGEMYSHGLAQHSYAVLQVQHLRLCRLGLGHETDCTFDP